MWFNPIISLLLRSPLHGFISKDMMLITVTGRKSGRVITTPVSYVREGDKLWIISSRNRNWWRNLLGGAPVTLRLAGQEVKGHGDAILDEVKVALHLRELLTDFPALARYLDVRMEDGKPTSEDIDRAIRTRLLVRIKVTAR